MAVVGMVRLIGVGDDSLGATFLTSDSLRIKPYQIISNLIKVSALIGFAGVIGIW